jgi:DNA-binding NtrC family response regulator
VISGIQTHNPIQTNDGLFISSVSLRNPSWGGNYRRFRLAGGCMASEKRVLIVDDEHAIADTLTMIFSNAGYTARATYSAEQALPLIAEWNPHLAIIDVRLPGMNGVDLAIRVRAESPLCYTLLFTGDSSVAELLESARQQGHHFDVLAKPVPPVDFLNTVAGFFPPSQGLAPVTA